MQIPETHPDAPYVVRIKSPETGVTVIQDQVQGDVTIKNDQLDDMVLLRSDGTPVYMLAVVVDDYDMGITHVIRGDDHLNNAARQMMIYNAMGWELPVYAHLPLILGEDGKKLVETSWCDLCRGLSNNGLSRCRDAQLFGAFGVEPW